MDLLLKALLLAAAVAVALGVVGAWRRRRLRRLSAERSGATVEAFVSAFPPDYSRENLLAVYQHFQAAAEIPDFPVLPSDDLGDLYGIVDEDVVEEVKELFGKCGVPWPPAERYIPVITVGDAAHFLEQHTRAVAGAQRAAETDKGSGTS